MAASHVDARGWRPLRSLALMPVLDPSTIHRGRVHARYFRENFAQGGIDLVQIIPELVTNADAAIASSGRRSGRIVLALGEPDPDFLVRWPGAPRRGCGRDHRLAKRVALHRRRHRRKRSDG